MRVLLLARVPGGGLEQRPQGRVQADPAQTAECQLKNTFYTNYHQPSTQEEAPQHFDSSVRMCTLRACAHVRVPPFFSSFSPFSFSFSFNPAAMSSGWICGHLLLSSRQKAKVKLESYGGNDDTAIGEILLGQTSGGTPRRTESKKTTIIYISHCVSTAYCIGYTPVVLDHFDHYCMIRHRWTSPPPAHRPA